MMIYMRCIAVFENSKFCNIKKLLHLFMKKNDEYKNRRIKIDEMAVNSIYCDFLDLGILVVGLSSSSPTSR